MKSTWDGKKLTTVASPGGSDGDLKSTTISRELAGDELMQVPLYDKLYSCKWTDTYSTTPNSTIDRHIQYNSQFYHLGDAKYICYLFSDVRGRQCGSQTILQEEINFGYNNKILYCKEIKRKNKHIMLMFVIILFIKLFTNFMK